MSDPDSPANIRGGGEAHGQFTHNQISSCPLQGRVRLLFIYCSAKKITSERTNILLQHAKLPKVRKNPRNVISEFLIFGTDPVLWLQLFESLSPPIHEYDDIKESVDTRSVEIPPISLDLTRDLATFEQPPGGLDQAPPNENRVYEA